MWILEKRKSENLKNITTVIVLVWTKIVQQDINKCNDIIINAIFIINANVIWFVFGLGFIARARILSIILSIILYII